MTIDVFGRNAHGVRQKVFDSFLALTLGAELHELFRIVGGYGLAAVVDDEGRLVHCDLDNTRRDRGGV